MFIDAVSGSMSEWYRAQFGQLAELQAAQQDRSVWSLLMDEANAVEPGARGVAFLPHLSGCTSPVKDPKSLGAFVGISQFTTKGMFVRALVEGLNYQARQMVEAIECTAGEMQCLRAVGGITRNAFWMQNRADVLGRCVEIPDMEEATCLGAALLAGLGVGLYQSEAQAFAQVYRPGRIYDPRPEAATIYEKLFRKVYMPLYDSLKDVHHTIYDLFRS
jgi:xylulokinase